MPQEAPAVPLPAFRRPPAPDDPLPTIPADPEESSSHPETDSPPDRPRPTPAPDDRPAPIESSRGKPAADRTRISSAGDQKIASEAIGGLLVMLAAAAAALLSRNGRHLRQPTGAQVDAIAEPLGAIAARHLPTEVISKDLLDAARATKAAHAYGTDGRLVERIPTITEETP